MILEEHKVPNLIQALRFSAGKLQQEHSWKQTKLLSYFLQQWNNKHVKTNLFFGLRRDFLQK